MPGQSNITLYVKEWQMQIIGNKIIEVKSIIEMTIQQFPKSLYFMTSGNDQLHFPLMVKNPGVHLVITMTHG